MAIIATTQTDSLNNIDGKPGKIIISQYSFKEITRNNQKF